MVVDRDRQFVTQRTAVELARIDTHFDKETLLLAHEKFGTCEVPLELNEGKRVDVGVWDSRVQATVFSDAHEWISRVIGADADLVFMPDDSIRRTNPKRSEPGDHVSFADGYPLSICNESSLADLDARLDEPVAMDRFRPNVIVRGPAAFEEDTWKSIRIGAVPLRVAKVADRCMIVARDQQSGALTKEPLRTLATYRKWDNTVWFGIAAIPDAEGTIAVGDQLIAT